MIDISLYLVTDRQLSLGRDLEWIVEEAVQGGVTMVQLREKEFTTREFIRLAASLKQRLSSYSVPLIINDRLDVVLASDADGIHIGQSDIPYELVRKLLGPGKIIGLSVENMEQVSLANNLEIDYIGISPVFSTATKTDTAQPFGLKGIAKVMDITRHPAVAIGGINSENASSVIGAGANGIAVVSAICSANSPKEASRDLKNKIKSILKQ